MVGFRSRFIVLQKNIKNITLEYNAIHARFHNSVENYLNAIERQNIQPDISEIYDQVRDLLAIMDRDSMYTVMKNVSVPASVVAELTRSGHNISGYISASTTTVFAIGNLANAFVGIKVNTNIVVQNPANQCASCNSANLRVDYESSEIICDDCNVVTVRRAEITEDEQMYNNNISYTKQKNHSELEHAHKWLDYILGKVDITIPQSDIELIFNEISKDYKLPKGYNKFNDMTCHYVRQKIKQIKLTKYNKYVVYIRAKVTEMMGNSVRAPTLTTDEIEHLISEFGAILNGLKQIKSIGGLASDKKGKSAQLDKSVAAVLEENSQQNIYYPYFWYKIIQAKMARDSRKNALLSCIHIQSKSANARREEIWNLLIQLPELKRFNLSYNRING